MNAHSSFSAASSSHVALPSNNHLPVELETKLTKELVAAVKNGDRAAIDVALTRIVGTCEPHKSFVTPFQNRTKPAGMLIARLLGLGLNFRLHWTEGGLGDEAMPPELPKAPKTPKPEVPVKAGRLDADTQARLTDMLRNAVRSGAYGPLDRALASIVEVCTAAGVTYFVTPYADKTKTAGELIGRMRKRDETSRVYLRWTEGGLDGEAVAVAAAAPAPQKAKPSRAELEARKAANRAQRHAAQPAKGTPGQKK